MERRREHEREEREREEFRRLVEAFEWLEDHCWILSTEERANAAALVLKARQVAELDRRRLRLVYDRNRIEPQQV